MAVPDEAAADAGAERHHQHGLAALAAAVVILAQGGDVRVVAGLDPQMGQRAQGLVEIEDAPVQVDAAVDVAEIVHRAGHADAHAQHVGLVHVVRGQTVLDRRRDVRQDRGTAVLDAGRDLPFFDQASVFGKEAQLDGRAADVHSKRVFHEIQVLSFLYFFSL